MTICMNYDYDIYHRFVGSLFDSVDDNVKLMIFIAKNDENHIKRLLELYDNIIYKIVDNENTHIVNYRFKMYYDYLKLNQNYDYIFLCDSRDVLFQNNIFTHPLITNNHDLYIFEEESTNITIDKCQFNSLYITKSGLPIQNIVENKSILCVGTLLGNYKGIMSYLNCFNDILYNKVEIKNREYYGTDSGVNYYIIYGNLLKDIKMYICKNSDKLVYTLAFPNYLGLFDKKKILNDNNQICYKNEVVYCVHQYDRLDDNIKINMSDKYNYLI